MANWKDEDIATPELIKEYLEEFRSGINCNDQLVLSEPEKKKVQSALAATEQFCMELLRTRKNKLYMHDLILMAVGFYLSALDAHNHYPNPANN
jgi:hypothetical protein